MNTDSSLVNELREKAYRDAYVASQIRIALPFQIRALRTQHAWSQQELARRANMTQPRIAEIEKPGGRHLTIETLLRLAAAFDVGLHVCFAPFSELVEWAENFSPDAFEVQSFEDEIVEYIQDHEPVKTAVLPYTPVEIAYAEMPQQYFNWQDSVSRSTTITTTITFNIDIGVVKALEDQSIVLTVPTGEGMRDARTAA